MTKARKKYTKRSNNPENPNQNVCAQAVADALGVADLVRYLHSISDLVRALRKGDFLVRSRKSDLRGADTIGAVRQRIRAENEKQESRLDADYYVVRVTTGSGHVIILGRDGSTLIDTDPRKRDRRRVTHFYGVWGSKH